MLLAVIVVCMWLVEKLVSVGQISYTLQESLGVLLLAAGFVVTFAGVWSFRRAATTVDPLHPEKASVLVTSGIYRLSRNPMYLGMLLALLAWCVYLGSLFNIVLVAAFVWHMNRYQIPPEEKALQNLFGEQYIQYCRTTRRWI